MIPIRDNVPSRSLPFVNYAIITLNVFAFLQQLTAKSGPDVVVERYGMVPARVTHPDKPIMTESRELVRTRRGLTEYIRRRPIANPPFPAVFTLLTCIFLHGGWAHLIGNCWFLYIFGDNVEDRLGHGMYVLFYLICGVGASLAHWAAGPNSTVPTIGASGAIAGVMGAYFLLYPRAEVLTLVPIFVFLQFIVVPAWIFLGVWFAFQFLQGSYAITSHMQGGVAWWAHVGGFVVGGAGLFALKSARLLKSRQSYVPSARRVMSYRYRW